MTSCSCFISRVLLLISLSSLCGCQGAPRIDNLLNVETSSGSLQVHFVRTTQTPLGLFYESGSLEEGESEGYLNTSELPLLSEARHGKVQVRVYGAESESELARAFAETVSQGVSQARSEIWPGPAALPAQIKIYVRGPGTPRNVYQRRRLDRREGWDLAFAIDADDFLSTGTYSGFAGSLSHELFHLSQEDMPSRDGMATGDFARILEEVTASLYAHCTVLMLGETTSVVGEPEFTVAFEREGEIDEVVAPLPDLWLERLLTVLKTAEGGAAYSMHIPLRITAFAELSRGQQEIIPHTPEAEAMLSQCRQHAGSPSGIESWLRSIASDGVDAGLTLP